MHPDLEDPKWNPGKESRMNIKEVKDLIHEVLQSDISEFELEHTGTRVRLKRGFGRDSAVPTPIPSQSLITSVSIPPASTQKQTAQLTDSADDAESDAFHIITSPIVGTLYSAPSPGSGSFVQVGDHVKEGSVLCIVEAMKLMNEIPSDVDGEIVRIYVENGSPVEFGQKLFAIRPST
jgi:acetyl-CoA carboxylase biotin carboxyl carrier protein